MALRDEIRNEQKKLKDMPLSGKLKYIRYYYRIPILVGILAIILLIVFVRDWTRSSRPYFLHAVAINTILSYDEEYGDIGADYLSYASVDTDKYNCTIDTSLRMDLEGGDQMTMASEQKIMGLFSAGEIDVIMAPEEIVNYYASAGAFTDIRAFLSEEQIKSCEDAGYPLYYVSNENGTFPAGFYITDSAYLKKQGEHGTFIPEDLPVFAFTSCISHPDAAVKLLEMVTQ